MVDVQGPSAQWGLGWLRPAVGPVTLDGEAEPPPIDLRAARCSGLLPAPCLLASPLRHQPPQRFAALSARALGWIVTEDVTGSRPGDDFIYSPDKWSFIVALIAAATGVLSLTSAKAGGLSGVFISVIPVAAAGNIGLGAAFGAWGEVAGSAVQLALNISGMILAGWATLALQHLVWNRKARHRQRHLDQDHN